MSRFLVLAAALLCGCGPSAPPTGEPASVSVTELTRDRLAAQDRIGTRVRLALARGEYHRDGRRVVVPGTVPNTPPLVVCHCRGDVPDSPTGLVVEGRVFTVNPDGVWRTNRADFCVVLADCSAAPR